jgi:hypothetical protein
MKPKAAIPAAATRAKPSTSRISSSLDFEAELMEMDANRVLRKKGWTVLNVIATKVHCGTQLFRSILRRCSDQRQYWTTTNTGLTDIGRHRLPRYPFPA